MAKSCYVSKVCDNAKLCDHENSVWYTILGYIFHLSLKLSYSQFSVQKQPLC